MTALRIAEPCHESWTAMTPEGRGRHCAACAKTVIDITAMAPAEGRAVVARELPARLARGEGVCVRAHAARSGRLLRPGVRRYVLTNGLAALLAVSLAGCGGDPPQPALVGRIRYEPPPSQSEVEPPPGEVPQHQAEPHRGEPALEPSAEQPHPMVGVLVPIQPTQTQGADRHSPRNVAMPDCGILPP